MDTNEIASPKMIFIFLSYYFCVFCFPMPCLHNFLNMLSIVLCSGLKLESFVSRKLGQEKFFSLAYRNKPLRSWYSVFGRVFFSPTVMSFHYVKDSQWFRSWMLLFSSKSKGTEHVVTDSFLDFLHVLKFRTAQSVEYFVVVGGFCVELYYIFIFNKIKPFIWASTLQVCYMIFQSFCSINTNDSNI